MGVYPSYLNLRDEEWEDRVSRALEMLKSCRVCPHRCGVNRFEGKKGFCRVGRYVVVSSYFAHRGEERPIRGFRGSGTVFFSYCNMQCVYCQNYEISQLGEGKEVSPEKLAQIFLSVQRLGCHNLNLVTPSHVVPQIIEALYIAVQKGFKLPIVYNTSSYDSLESLKLLDGIVDIYLPDFKYADNGTARKYSGVNDYFDVAKEAIREMYRQVGDLVVDEHGVALRGVLVRHLVLPNGLAGTKTVANVLKEISPNIAVNVMNQYYPCYKAYDYPELARKITLQEFSVALRFMEGLKIIYD